MSSLRIRRVMLREVERPNPEVRSLGIRDRHMAKFRVLHGEASYEGLVDIEELKLEMEKVEEYINDAKKMVSSS